MNSKTKVGTKQEIYPIYNDGSRIGYEDLTFYVLDKKNNFNKGHQLFPYFRGIAVDKGLTTILYYHIIPND